MADKTTTGEIAISLNYIKNSIDELHKKADYTNGQVRMNTEFRIKSEAVLSLIKWLGFGQIITMIYLAMQFLTK